MEGQGLGLPGKALRADPPLLVCRLYMCIAGGALLHMTHAFMLLHAAGSGALPRAFRRSPFAK
jgi:hypothetical protein